MQGVLSFLSVTEYSDTLLLPRRQKISLKQAIRKQLFAITFYDLAKLLILMEPAAGLEPATY